MTSTPEEAELLKLCERMVAARLYHPAVENHLELNGWVRTTQVLATELKSRLLSPAPQNASNTDDLCAALLSASPATETATREELAREIYTVQAKVLGEHPQWDEVKAAAASQPWQKKSLDFVYDTADALRSEFNITRKEQP